MESRGILSTYTGTIIVANVITFIGFLILQNFIDPNNAVSWVALMPATILAGRGLWTFVTSMFMHAGLGHLFVNMISLMFIGGFVEKLIGKKRFLGLYFASGIFAGLFFVLIALATGIDLNVYAVGASGAIFGLGGLLAVLTPKLPVLVFFVIPMPMWAAMGFLIIVLWVLSLGLGLPIGNVAHLGGLLVGLGYGFYLKQKYPQKTKMISRHFAR
ncbi:MAG: rhomboid family intramembrane serine protease [archaeon]